MPHCIIYVPGLADKLNYSFGQRTALALWRLHRLRTQYFIADWANAHEPFAHKLQRLLQAIDAAKAKGYTVSLVAASAGSSLALDAFAARTTGIHRVLSICGKLHRPETVPKELLKVNPAFKASMDAYAGAEPKFTVADRLKILVVRASHDSYVPSADGHVTGASVYTMHSVGHVFSIFMALTVYQGVLIGFIKKKQK